MANVQISDLAFATLPLIGATTFFEVEATEGGVVVSRRVAADDLVISATTLFIDGTSTDDPSIGGGVFDGQLLWRNANAQQTGVFGFDPAGDNFIWSNDAEGGFHQIAIRDGTVLVETVAAASGGLLVQNLSTGGGLERVLTTADLVGAPSLGSLTDVTLTAPATGAVLYKSAGDWLDTPGVLIDPAADVKLHQATVEVFRTLTAAAGGAEANNTLTGAGFERVLTASDAFTGIIQGSSTDSPETPGGTWDGVLRFDNANDLQTARVGFDPAGDTFYVQPTVEGGRLILGGRSPGSPGVLRESLIFDFDTGALPAGSIRFFEPNGTAGLMRLDTGVSAVTGIGNVLNQPSGGFAQVGGFRVQNVNASPEISMLVGFNETIGTTTLQLKNFVHGGPVQLVGEDASGVERILYFYDPDNAGPIIFSRLDNDPTVDASIQDSRITFRNPSAETIWQIGFLEGTNDFSLKLFQDTGTLRLRGSSAASADTLLAIFDPVADAKLFQAGAEVFRTLGAAAGGAEANNTLTGAGFERVLTTADLGGAAVSGASPFDIASGAAADPTLTLTENVTLSTTLLHDVSTDITILRNEVNSGHLELRARSSSGGDAILARFDPDNRAEIFWNEALRLRTGQFGPEMIGSSATGCNIRLFGSGGSTLIGTINMGGGSTNSLSGVANATNNGQPFQVDFPDAGGTNRVGFRYDPDGGAELYTAGIRMLLTETNHLRIFPTVTDNQIRLELRNLLNVSTLADLGFNGSDNLEIRNFINSGHVEIRADTSGGVETLLANFDADAGSFLRHTDGLQRLATAATGIDVRGDGADSANITFEDTGVSDIGQIDISGSAMLFECQVDSNPMNFVGRSSGSVTRQLIQADPDDDIALFDDGTEVARTLPAASGGWEANNTLTGAGFERVLTVADRRSAEIYAPTNVSTVRAYDADATSIDELADVLGTLIADLQAIDVIQ